MVPYPAGDLPTAFRREYEGTSNKPGITVAAAWNCGIAVMATTHDRS
jgi:hypothetical protein